MNDKLNIYDKAMRDNQLEYSFTWEILLTKFRILNIVVVGINVIQSDLLFQSSWNRVSRHAYVLRECCLFNHSLLFFFVFFQIVQNSTLVCR